jgi:hypothetical protein
MPKSLRTNSSVWTRVFRRIVLQLETDPDVRRVVGVDNLRSWKGVAGDKSPFSPTSSAPVVRLLAMPKGVDWYSPDSQAGTLWVQVEMGIQSLCSDDVTDLWRLIAVALRPGGRAISPGTVSFALDLVALGAETGEIVFSDPTYDPQPAAEPEGFFFGAGHFRLQCLEPID